MPLSSNRAAIKNIQKYKLLNNIYILTQYTPVDSIATVSILQALSQEPIKCKSSMTQNDDCCHHPYLPGHILASRSMIHQCRMF